MPVPQPSPAGRFARFGVFEVDLVAGELRKGGVRIRLQEQPFQLLACLIERSGDLVTREELRQKLWPADTFVDFDHSLNTAINKLREALGDSASNPRYIETLARRGYRFLAPVQAEGASPGGTSGPEPGGQSQATAEPRTGPTLHPELDVPLPHRGLTRGLFALIQIMYLVFYVMALFHLARIYDLADDFLPRWAALAVQVAVVVTAMAGIPLRCYLISAVGFDYRRLGEKFQRLFLAILPLDQLWAVAPFLLVQKIGSGAALAATAALLYLPFSERTLVKMAYPADN